MYRWRLLRALSVVAVLPWVACLRSAWAEGSEDLRSAEGYGRETSPQPVLGEGLPTPPPRTPTEWRKTLAEWRRQIDPAALPEHNPEGEAAKERIRAIRDPNAVAALEAAFASEKNHNVRLVYLEALGRIEGPKTLKRLVDIAATHPGEAERQLAANLLGELPDRRDAIPPLIKYLRSNAYSSYAAEALSASGLTQSQSRSEPPDPALTTALIDALVLTGWRFDRVWWEGPPQGTGQGAGERGWQGGSSVYQRIVRVQFPILNEKAFQALVEYTGEDYGFDQIAWRKWYERRRADTKKSQ